MAFIPYKTILAVWVWVSLAGHTYFASARWGARARERGRGKNTNGVYICIASYTQAFSLLHARMLRRC